MKAGVVGLGIMGGAVATHLHRCGLLAGVYNRSLDKALRFRELGVYVAKSPGDLARHVDVVLIFVSDGPDVEEVLFGAGGVAEGARRGLVVVDMSTNSPRWAVEFAKRLGALGVEFVDAPVTGGQRGAVEGTLVVMAGGREDVVASLTPVFKCFSKEVVYVGPVGSGQALKLVNQLVVALNTVAMVEGIRLAEALGLDLGKAAGVLSKGAARSGSIDLYLDKLLAGDLSPGFKAAHLKKDLGYVLEVAKSLGLELPGAALAFELYKKMVELGWGELGIHGLGLVYR